MIYSVNFMDLTEKINPHAVVRYLKDTGWMQYKTKKEYIKIFQKITEKEEFYQVIIPIDKTLADYKKAMFDAIEQIAFLEGQSTEQLMLYLLNPNTEVVQSGKERWRMTNREVYERDYEELEQYRKIGTVKECREAVEKQEPKKPEVSDSDYDYYKCPVCGAYIWATDCVQDHNYCLNCGQAIDWEESEE